MFSSKVYAEGMPLDICIQHLHCLLFSLNSVREKYMCNTYLLSLESSSL